MHTGGYALKNILADYEPEYTPGKLHHAGNQSCHLSNRIEQQSLTVVAVGEN